MLWRSDLQTDMTTLLAQNVSGGYGNIGTYVPTSISSDNRYVAFWATSTNLVPGDTNGRRDVFVRDRLMGATMSLTIPGEMPVADFTGTPLSGPAPLTVQFTDQSTNAPTSWAWDFENDGIIDSTLKNPQHTYSSPGTYTVSLTVTNGGGSDTETKTGYVVVTAGYPARYAFIEAGSGGCMEGDVNDFKDSLYGLVQDPKGWTAWGSPNPVLSAEARVKHWADGTRQDYLDKADFAYFHGHGNMDGTTSIHFENAEPDGLHDLRPDMADWGYETGSRIKWITFHSCDTLSEETWQNWVQSFHGLHMILGYDTPATCPSLSTGQAYAELMRGAYQGNTTVMPIRDAWKWANWYTVNDPSRATGMIFVDACHDDYLPGYGGWQNNCNPTREGNGNFVISYQKWNADPDFYSQKSRTLQSSLIVTLTEGNYHVDAEMNPVPEKIMIYVPTEQEISPEKPGKISKELGMSGTVTEIKTGYTNDPIKGNQFFLMQKKTGTISYEDLSRWKKARDIDVPGKLPSDDEAIARATEFLTAADLLPQGALLDGTRHNPTETLFSPTRKEITRETVSVIYGRELNGLPVQNSKILVEIGGNSDIISLFMNWRDYSPYKEVTIKPVDTAFNEFTTRQLQYRLSEGETERIMITGVTLKYYSQVAAAAAAEKYLQPVYVFEGYVQSGDESVPFEPVYIPATVEQFDNIPGCIDGVCT